MSPEQLDLARRLVAHPRWRWVAGMVAVGSFSTHRIDTTKENGRPVRVESHPDFEGTYSPVHVYANADSVPDLTDYATAAILLRMAMWEGQAMEFRWLELEPTGDLGTVAATALLEAWGEEGAGRRET